MKIDFKEMEHEGEILYAPVVGGKEASCYFESKGMAIIYAGLLESGLSLNDCSYLSRYITFTVRGLKGDK